MQTGLAAELGVRISPEPREVMLSLQVAAGEAVTLRYVVLESSQDVEP